MLLMHCPVDIKQLLNVFQTQIIRVLSKDSVLIIKEHLSLNVISINVKVFRPWSLFYFCYELLHNISQIEHVSVVEDVIRPQKHRAYYYWNKEILLTRFRVLKSFSFVSFQKIAFLLILKWFNFNKIKIHPAQAPPWKQPHPPPRSVN